MYSYLQALQLRLDDAAHQIDNAAAREAIPLGRHDIANDRSAAGSAGQRRSRPQRWWHTLIGVQTVRAMHPSATQQFSKVLAGNCDALAETKPRSVVDVLPRSRRADWRIRVTLHHHAKQRLPLCLGRWRRHPFLPHDLISTRVPDKRRGALFPQATMPIALCPVGGQSSAVRVARAGNLDTRTPAAAERRADAPTSPTSATRASAATSRRKPQRHQAASHQPVAHESVPSRQRALQLSVYRPLTGD